MDMVTCYSLSTFSTANGFRGFFLSDAQALILLLLYWELWVVRVLFFYVFHCCFFLSSSFSIIYFVYHCFQWLVHWSWFELVLISPSTNAIHFDLYFLPVSLWFSFSYWYWHFKLKCQQEASVVEGNGPATGHIISTTIVGKNGESKRVRFWKIALQTAVGWATKICHSLTWVPLLISFRPSVTWQRVLWVLGHLELSFRYNSNVLCWSNFICGAGFGNWFSVGCLNA